MVKNLPANEGDTRDRGLIPWRRNPVFLCLENSTDREALRATVHGGHKEMVQFSSVQSLIRV